MNSKNQQSDGLSRRQGFMPLRKLFHKKEVRGACGQSDYRMAVTAIVSISQSPKRVPSASRGRSCMLVRFAIFVAFVGRNVLLLQPFNLNLGIK